MSLPSISIIIPSYFRLDFLEHSLHCLLCQTDPDFEVVVVNDAIDVNVSKLVDSFNQRLNIRYSETDYSVGGPSKPRNLGASLATGEYICFLDNDDYFLPNKIAEIKTLLHSRRYDFIFHPLYLTRSLIPFEELYKFQCQSNFKTIGNIPPFISSLEESLTNYGNFIATSSVVFKKSSFHLLGGFNESPEYNVFEDYDLWLRLSSRKMNWAYIKSPLGAYFMSPDGISRSLEKRLSVLISIHKLLLFSRFRVWHFYAKQRVHVHLLFSKPFRITMLYNYAKHFFLLSLATLLRFSQFSLLCFRSFLG